MFNDQAKAIQELQIECYGASINKGFWDAYNRIEGPDSAEIRRAFQMQKIALIHSELSELLEALRKPAQPDEHCPDFYNVEIEAADVLIRLLDFSASQRFRLGAAVKAKLEFNATRPHMHGKNS